MTITNNDWLVATVNNIIDESPIVKTYAVALPRPIHYVAGQHCEVRLTASNGYQAARPYSISSAQNGSGTLELTIQLVPDGEVSPYMYADLMVGDKVELRGPFGKFFVWDETVMEPVFLIAGGSGVVPMRSMLSHHAASDSRLPMKLLYSAKTYDDILFKSEFVDNPDVTITLTRENPKTWNGLNGRIDSSVLKNLLEDFSRSPVCYVCGMNQFVTAVTDSLQALGIPAAMIKTERFG